MRQSTAISLLLLAIAPAVAASSSPDELRAKANALLVGAQKAAVFAPDVDRAPYHEQVSFVFHGLVHGDERGTFVNDYVSKEQWRWKWEIPDYQEINVRNGKQIGESETAEFEPVRILQLRWALPPFWVVLDASDLVKKIELENVNGQEAQCVKFETVRGHNRESREICLNAANSTPLRWFEQGPEENREFEWTDYVPFRKGFYPRHLVVKDRGTKTIEADIEFQEPHQLPPNAFQIPSGMRIRKACDHFVEAVVTRREDPVYPMRIGRRNVGGDVVLEVKVSAEGKVDAAQITQTGGEDLDVAAMDAVKKWAFEPAKCDGESVAHKISVMVHFHNH